MGFLALRGSKTARGGSIAVGLVLMLLVAPFLWFVGIGSLFFAGVAGLGLIGLAWIAGIAGLGLFIYGLVAKSNLERAALRIQATGTNQTVPAPEPQSKYCPDCGTLNSVKASVCESCGFQFPTGWPRPPWG